MAIENHPQYPKWSEALDQLKAASDKLQHAVAFREGEAAIAAARAEVIFARERFNRLSDEIDEA